MFGGFGTALIQFLWDYVAYMNSINLNDCANYYDSSSFLSLIQFLLLKVVTLYSPPYIVFYIYYYRNRHIIKTVNENILDRNLQVFYDSRSDLLEEMELED